MYLRLIKHPIIILKDHMTLKTEDWSNDTEDSALITGIKCILKCIHI